MTRKHIVSLLAGLLILTAVQATAAPKDLVVLLDTSSSMFAHADTMGSAVIQPLLSSRVSQGDTVHIVSFAEDTRLELSRKVESPADIETIATHLLLLYPLEPWSDVIQALDWTAQYLKQLPSYRPKTLVVISDGEHIAPPGSPNAALTVSEAKTRIEQSAQELKGNGWDFIYLKTPWPAPAATRDENVTGPGVAQTGQDAQSGDTEGNGGVSGSTGEAAGNTTTSRPSKEPVAAAGTLGGSTETSGPSSSADTSPRSSITGTPAKENTDNSIAESPASTDTTDRDSATDGTPADEGPDGGFDSSDTLAQALPADIHEVDSSNDGVDSTQGPLSELIISWPEELGKVRYRFTLPVRVRNTGAEELLVECRELLVEGENILEKPLLAKVNAGDDKKLKFKLALGEDFAVGKQTLSVRAIFSGEANIHPTTADIALDLVGKPAKNSGRLLSTLLLIAGIVLALALAILILVSFRRSLSSPAKAVYRTTSASRQAGSSSADRRETDRANDRAGTSASKEADDSRNGSRSIRESDSQGPAQAAGSGKGQAARPNSATPMAGGAAIAGTAAAARNLPVTEDFPVRRHEERIMLSLHVNDQNTAIGRRNVHLLKAGSKLSLGGGNSDFLVFIVRFPERIAKVHFDGEQCHLTIHKPEFFPNAESAVIEDCIGKRIDIVSSKGYKVWFRIDRYEDPLEKLNRFLRSIEHQHTGMPLR